MTAVDDQACRLRGGARVAGGIGHLDGEGVRPVGEGRADDLIVAKGIHNRRANLGVAVKKFDQAARRHAATDEHRRRRVGMAGGGAGVDRGNRGSGGSRRCHGVDHHGDRVGGGPGHPGNRGVLRREVVGAIRQRCGRRDAPTSIRTDNAGANGVASAIPQGHIHTRNTTGAVDGGGVVPGDAVGWGKAGIAGRVKCGHGRLRRNRGIHRDVHGWCKAAGVAGRVFHQIGDGMAAIDQGWGSGNGPVAALVHGGGTGGLAIDIQHHGVTGGEAAAGKVGGGVAGDVVGVGTARVRSTGQVGRCCRGGRWCAVDGDAERVGSWPGQAGDIGGLAGDIVHAIRDRAGWGDGVVAIGIHHAGAGKHAIHKQADGIARCARAVEGRGLDGGDVVGVGCAGVGSRGQVGCAWGHR